MSKNFNFGELVREPDTFTDVDGKVYEVRSSVDLGAADMARARRVQNQLNSHMDRLEKHPDDERAATGIDDAVDQLLSIAIPGMQIERLRAMTLGQKQAILDWWNAAQAERKNLTSQAAN